MAFGLRGEWRLQKEWPLASGTCHICSAGRVHRAAGDHHFNTTISASSGDCNWHLALGFLARMAGNIWVRLRQASTHRSIFTVVVVCFEVYSVGGTGQVARAPIHVRCIGVCTFLYLLVRLQKVVVFMIGALCVSGVDPGGVLALGSRTAPAWY